VSRGDPPRVAVLGSARLAPPHPAWDMAAQVGAELARKGAVVVTGGYGGLMAAAGQAARAAGGKVIGLPMRDWESLTPDAGCTELRWVAGYDERLRELLACDAVIACTGGVGTLSELAVAWAAAQTEPSAPRVVTVGRGWQALLDALAEELVIDERDRALVITAPDAERAVAAALSAAPTPAPAPRG
jgi:uncharacterized protein (TIGR00725 family)